MWGHNNILGFLDHETLMPYFVGDRYLNKKMILKFFHATSKQNFIIAPGETEQRKFQMEYSQLQVRKYLTG